jgi:hypothetical protein
MTNPIDQATELLKAAEEIVAAEMPREEIDTDAVCRHCRYRVKHAPACPSKDDPYPTFIFQPEQSITGSLARALIEKQAALEDAIEALTNAAHQFAELRPIIFGLLEREYNVETWNLKARLGGMDVAAINALAFLARQGAE